MLGTHALIPVASLAEAKSRLRSTLSESQTSRLVLCMLEDVSSVLLRHKRILATSVVSPDNQVLDFASSLGLLTIKEEGASGLNSALAAATEFLIQSYDAPSCIVLPVDIPLLQESSVTGAFEAAEEERGQVVVAARSSNGGTNLLLRAPCDVIRPSFGIGSFSTHQKVSIAKGVRFKEWASQDTALDIDTPTDLMQFRKIGKNTRTFEFLEDVFAGV